MGENMLSGLPEIDDSLCNGCGECVEKCPGGAVAIVDGKAAIVDASSCRYCTDCEEACPARAITCPFEIILINPAGPEK